MLHGQTRYHIRSRFFDELPPVALKWLSPRQAGFGSGYAPQPAWERNPAAVAPKPAVATPGGGLRSGQSVFHAKFGEGVILTLEGRGSEARAQVNFGRHGTKWLALSVAKLTPID